MDAAILQAPVFGNWLRDIAVLQLMEVLGSLMDAGYNLAEALGEAARPSATGPFGKACATCRTPFAAARNSAASWNATARCSRRSSANW